MKKLLTIAILVLAAATMAHGQGSQNVKSTYGSGAPGNSTPCSKIGDEYTDISVSIQYVATAITQSPAATSCTWTPSGGVSGGACSGANCFSPVNYAGWHGNGREVLDATWSGGGNTITC